ncbi:MAG: hypothetical protein FJW34_27310, partial [Acidobacteria bacterium]|nr:hypothetical protein [Acidobacteriota bacterium]
SIGIVTLDVNADGLTDIIYGNPASANRAAGRLCGAAAIARPS